jgi:surface antigen
MRTVSPRGVVTALLAVLIGLMGCTRHELPLTTLASADELYKRLGPVDVRLAEAARLEALETRQSGEPSLWENTATGSSGLTTPLSTFRTSTGYYCRRYREAAGTQARGEASVVGTACRDDTGVWRNVAL